MLELATVQPNIDHFKGWLDLTIPSDDPRYTYEANPTGGHCRRNGCTGRRYLGPLATSAMHTAHYLSRGGQETTESLAVDLITLHSPECKEPVVARVIRDSQHAEGQGDGRSKMVITKAELVIARAAQNELYTVDKDARTVISQYDGGNTANGSTQERVNLVPTAEDIGRLLMTMRTEITGGLRVSSYQPV